ncbi:MAG: hypothetical protein DI536_28995 [Archangium gephyra]|uniref:Uncharacterized protein n=1 Tax=Archangium gephyra TaxID=48 RepID=A0A2W5T4J4_9BACT|nr:MAG: hypothetical protein DI536_28995 [Archangium gephyra]
MSAVQYKLTLRPDGRGVLCDPPGPCRCGHVAALFVFRGGDSGCASCMPEETTQLEQQVTAELGAEQLLSAA